MPSTSTVAWDTPLFVKVSINTTVCPPITVVDPFVGGLVGPVGPGPPPVEPVGPGPPPVEPVGPGPPPVEPVGPPPVEPPGAELWNCGGSENGSRPEKIGLGVGPPWVGDPLPLGPVATGAV